MVPPPVVVEKATILGRVRAKKYWIVSIKIVSVFEENERLRQCLFLLLIVNSSSKKYWIVSIKIVSVFEENERLRQCLFLLLIVNSSSKNVTNKTGLDSAGSLK